jgi:branched-chain amino acid transport system permease protein
MAGSTKTRLLGLLAAGALLLAPLLGIEPRTYLTLTVAGLAMGMLVFLVASGLTLIFGLMDVLNFAHGALFAWGAFAGYSAAVLLDRRFQWAASASVAENALLLLAAVAVAVAVAAGLGLLLERVIVRPVYGQHLFQILITLGATIVLEELIRIAWGPNDQVMPVPATLQGSWDVADVVVLRFPVVAIGLGLVVAIFSQSVRPAMGGEQLIFAFIVVIIGGLGSVTGSLVGALLVGLSYNYVAFLLPKAAIGVNMALMVLILLLRPTGLFGGGK